MKRSISDKTVSGTENTDSSKSDAKTQNTVCSFGHTKKSRKNHSQETLNTHWRNFLTSSRERVFFLIVIYSFLPNEQSKCVNCAVEVGSRSSLLASSSALCVFGIVDLRLCICLMCLYLYQFSITSCLSCFFFVPFCSFLFFILFYFIFCWNVLVLARNVQEIKGKHTCPQLAKAFTFLANS